MNTDEDEYVSVAKVGDIPENGQRVLNLGGRPVLLCHSKGEYFAVENMCTHEYTPLQGGTMSQCVIVCPLHGAEFDLRTGRALTAPAYDPLSTYPVRINGDMIEVGRTPNPI